MATLIDLARHWARQTQKGKGIRIEGADLDLLNAIGVGEMIQVKAAEEQRELCGQRLMNSTAGGNTGSPTIDGGTDPSARRSSRSSGTTKPLGVTASARRAQRTSNRRKTS
ncbi:hypothetical protein [Sphingomonas sanxanigenens]|uniref:hypothetical protein n=1 Tax=Sphingomonas sanxanigenens TaxID=397260 RepID=UPI00130172FE|nr:hypothetical protein [Sphingomonas sanxanigenens]